MRPIDDYLADSLDFEGEVPTIADAEDLDPSKPVDEATRRRLFTTRTYPYSKRIAAKQYYREKYRLQVELVKLQNWVKEHGERLLLIFEGRDAAGKGATIKRFMEYLNPRGARVVALAKPTEVEQGQWYFQRYVRQLPDPGEIVFFDRSWYNRAGVERVMGFSTDEQRERFFDQVPRLESMLVRDGVRLVKFYFSVSRAEQARRFHERRTHPLKGWKLSPMDVAAEKKWDDYTAAKIEMFRRTHTDDAPWTIIKSDDKMRARLAAMRFVLLQCPYEGRPDDIEAPDPLLLADAGEIYL